MDIEKLKERKTDRRSPRGQFLIPVADRRRPGYERRNRTSVLPMPLAMALRGERRRFEEAGTE